MSLDLGPDHGLDSNLDFGVGGGEEGSSTQVPSSLAEIFGFDPSALVNALNVRQDTVFNKGEIGDTPIAQTDVRTPLMRLFEAASAPMVAGTLLNPTALPHFLQQQAGGAPPGTAGFDQQNPAAGMLGGGLSNLLFNQGSVPQTGGGIGPITSPGVPGGNLSLDLQVPGSDIGPIISPGVPGGNMPPDLQVPGGGTEQPPPQEQPPDQEQPPAPEQPPTDEPFPDPTGEQVQSMQELAEWLLSGQTGDLTFPSGSIFNQSPQSPRLDDILQGREFDEGFPGRLAEILASVSQGTGEDTSLLALPGGGMLALTPQWIQLAQGAAGASAGLEQRQFGGPLDLNAFTIVGEDGPELIPPGNQEVIPLQQQQQGQGSGGGNDLPMQAMNFSPDNQDAGGLNISAMNQPGGNNAQGSGGLLQNMLQNPAPEQQAFDFASDFLTGTQGLLGDDLNLGGRNIGLQGNDLLGGALGNLQSLLGGDGAPEQQVFQQAQTQLGEGGNPGQGVVDALQPIFERNLQRGLNDLTNTLPSVTNTAAGQAGTDLARQAMQDFNLTAAQALQQGQQQQTQNLGLLGQLAGQAGNAPFQRGLAGGQFGLGLSQAQSGEERADIAQGMQDFFTQRGQQLQGLGLLGQLSGQAGQAPFQRALGAGQLSTQRDLGLLDLAQRQQQFLSNFGLQQQQQNFNQMVNPTLQLLMAALQTAQPTGFQTIVGGG